MRLLAAVLLCALTAAAANRELIGKVVDAQTGAPVVRAHVTLHFYQGQPPIEVALLTDADGSFHITNLPDLGYQITCEKPGYLQLNEGRSFAPASEPAAALTLRMTAQAAMEGIVVDGKDVPVPYATVQLVRQQISNGHIQFQTTSGASADEAGNFRLSGLAAGRYFVGVVVPAPSGFRSKKLAYPTFYYPKSADIETAQPFDLKAGDEQQLRIRVPEAQPSFEISGTVSPSGQNVSISFNRAGVQPPLNGSTASNWDAKTSSFKISHVLPGTYIVTAGLQQEKTWLQASRMVTVGDADVTELRLEPSDSGLDGTVRQEGAAPGRPLQFIQLQAARYNGGGQVDADGKFHIVRLPPDTYRVMPQFAGPQCVHTILQGGRDGRDGVTVPLEGTAEPIDIVVTSHCGSVEVSLAATNTPQNLIAVLLRKSGNELVEEKVQYQGGRMAQTSSTFQFQGVTPGDYTVYAWPQDAQIEYASEEYMRQFASYGKAVTVTEDAKVSVTLDKVLVLPAK